MTYRVIQGDCVERMRELPEASVDAVVCDPPYGLEFMGKQWDNLWTDREPEDHKRPENKGQTASPFISARVNEYRAGKAAQDWHEAWAREALRVLKPGGHLLAFGGTRTYHRLAAGIEDAGFEIRDTVAWMYGSGFPKSLDVSKQIDKTAPRAGMFDAFASHFTERWEASGLKRSEFVPYFPHYKNAESVMAQLSNWKLAKNVPSPKDFAILRDLISVSDEWGPLIERVEAEREKVGEKPSSLGGTVAAGERDPEFIARHRALVFDVTAPATPEAQAWDGWGTALKPAHEPIVVARKPLDGTVAANVLRHGTGALHIDACRIGTDERLVAGGPKGRLVGDERAGPAAGMFDGDSENTYQSSQSGRWPANVVLSHSEGCVPIGTRRVKSSNAPRDTSESQTNTYGWAKGGIYKSGQRHGDADGLETVTAWECEPGCPVRMLDEQTGTLTSGSLRGSYVNGPSEFNQFNSRERVVDREGDSGGASRFFANFVHRPEPGDLTRARYAAKASSAERNAGLDGFEAHGIREGLKNSTPRSYQINDAIHGGTAPKQNVHPTVKPVELMRWLIRLVTPPGGVVLDPFLGSGTTGCAAVLERVEFIGIERDPEYVPIAQARIAWWAEHPDGMQLVKRLEHEAERKTVAESGQTSMFDMLAEQPPPTDTGNGRAGEASAEKRYTERGASNFAMKPGRRRL